MTLSQLYFYGKNQLENAQIESAGYNSLALLGFCCGFNGRGEFSVRSSEIADQATIQKFSELIKMRTVRPLQYILGKWEFYSMELCVGEGVLVPRDDTEVLASCVIDFTGDKNAIVYDLCAGSGAVALAVARCCKNARVTAVELSDDAFKYLKINTERYGENRVELIKDDVCSQHFISCMQNADVIVSNPPYIPTGDIANLQWEVKCEPSLALDGGNDGLDFYRFYAKNTVNKLNSGGMLAVEVGIHQCEAVAQLFTAAGLKNVSIDNDINNIGRVVWGIRE